jgi:hypothetical protein
MDSKELVRRGHRPGSLADHYAALLTQQAASGVSMRHFAALAGVSACTLYAWKRRKRHAIPAAPRGGAPVGPGALGVRRYASLAAISPRT